MTRIYSYTIKLSAFLLRGRGGARFRGRWISIIDAFKVEACLPVNVAKIVQKNISVQIVQEKIFDVIRIKHCFLTKIILISYCGTFSYASMVKSEWTNKMNDTNHETTV